MNLFTIGPILFQFVYQVAMIHTLENSQLLLVGVDFTKVSLICVTKWYFMNFSNTLDGPLPDTLQHVDVPVITNKECETMYRKAGYVEEIPNIFICAGLAKGSKDSCEVSFNFSNCETHFLFSLFFFPSLTLFLSLIPCDDKGWLWWSISSRTKWKVATDWNHFLGNRLCTSKSTRRLY